MYIHSDEPQGCQLELNSYTKWGPVQKHEWIDEYDGVFEWATYGWARIEGSLAPINEFFRLNINNDPYGDA
jgi:hypothetical protein